MKIETITKKLKENVKKMAKLTEAKKKEKMVPHRFWDFEYANKFMRTYRDDIVLLTLEMYNDSEVKEIFIKDGVIIQTMGAAYSMGSGRIDGTWGSVCDYPCMHVVYKGGAEQYLACYKDLNNIESYSYGHRQLFRAKDTVNIFES